MFEEPNFAKFQERSGKELHEYIEQMAGAFLKLTGLPPDRVVMMVEQDYSNWKYTQKIWFEERKD